MTAPEPRCIQGLAGTVSRLWSTEAPKPIIRNHTHEADHPAGELDTVLGGLEAAMAPPRTPTNSRTA
jgi:hypothetical protein